MVGAGLQFNRGRGEEHFYNPKPRRNFQSQRGHSDVTAGQCKEKYVRRRQPENRAGEISERITMPLSNVERFLKSITPSVPAHSLSKTNMINLGACGVECKPYFVLADLWESFQEWSAYGVGVPLLLNGKDSVVQYYVPYLSAIQIYVDPSKSLIKKRRESEDSDGDYSSRDSSSDWSSDSEHERVSAYSRMSLVSQQTAPQEGFSSDDGESANSQEHVVFQYLEQDPPYGREPLSDKIADLALRFPDLKNLHSSDLTPSSWISVAWYPIYKIPTGPVLRDLEACFLTYHSLHTQIQVTYPSEIEDVPKISLPAFGLTSYKYRGSFWTSSNGTDRHLVNSLSQEAANWLTLLKVNHPDHSFFSGR